MAGPIVLRLRLIDSLVKPALLGCAVSLALYWLLGVPDSSFLPAVPGVALFGFTGYLATRNKVILDGQRVVVQRAFGSQAFKADEILALRLGSPGPTDRALSIATIFGPGSIASPARRLALELRSGERVITPLPVAGDEFARWSEASRPWRSAFSVSMYG